MPPGDTISDAARLSEPSSTAPTLRLSGLRVYYGKVYAVDGVDLEVHAGEVVALLGANGAGKSSVVKAIMGLVPVTRGVVEFKGRSLGGRTSDARVAEGLAYVPEGRRVFADLTVRENLLMGGYVVRDRAVLRSRLSEIYALFPILAERHGQMAATLSGGEQQMLAIGRALMRGPELLLLDEPSLGLAPVAVSVMYRTIRRISEQGMTILLAEQSAHLALQIARRAYVMQTGRLVYHGPADRLRTDPAVREAYLGGGLA
jgi:branched-chain amino acid transport system ATP-binding protein